jgi:hypothetical protein
MVTKSLKDFFAFAKANPQPKNGFHERTAMATQTKVKVKFILVILELLKTQKFSRWATFLLYLESSFQFDFFLTILFCVTR